MRWLWIDTIVHFEAGQRLVAVKAVSRAEEHLHDHFPADDTGPATPIMPASLMIEGVAQTAGILVGSVNEFREKVILAKISTARFDRDVAPGQVIRYDAAIERIDEAGASTTGRVERLSPGRDEQWQPIGQVDLIFSHADRNLSGLVLPEENFVFSDNFRALLQDAGLLDLIRA